MLAIDLCDQSLILLAERAIFWPALQTLIIADPHWGKAAAFRAAALPVPETAPSDLARLSALLAQTGATRLLILGDLLHAKRGRSSDVLEAVADWRERHRRLAIELVRGNHDRHAGDPPAAWGITCRDEPVAEPPFVWRHTPQPAPDGYVLAGHLHPAVTLRGPGRQRETLPCFHFGPDVGLLPAFGSFTGTARISPQPGDRVFVIAGDQVVPVST